jgi:hypothetical protein
MLRSWEERLDSAHADWGQDYVCIVVDVEQPKEGLVGEV